MRTNRYAILIGVAAVHLCTYAASYEIKGISPGAALSSIDLTRCRQVPNADSGIPGYRCDTTYGGAPAVMTIVVGDQKVIAVKILVEGQVMSPIRAALEEKHGRASKPNRYIESYQWTSGADLLIIDENRVSNGYTVMSVNFDLYNAIANQQKAKAKGDL